MATYQAVPKWINSDQRWRLDVRVGGKRRVFTSSKPGKPGNKEVMRKYNAAVEGATDKSGWRLSKCWEEYLQDVKINTSSGNYDQREKFGRLYILPKIGYKKVGSIKVGDWQDCITFIKPKLGKPLAKKSLMNLKSTIVNFCRYAKEHGMVDTLPDALRLPRNARTVGKEILQPNQLGLLFDPSDEWYANAWRLMVVTGMRPGEVYGLKIEDTKGGMVTIRRSINWDGDVTEGKNDNAKRSFMLHSIAQEIVDNQIAKVKAAKMISPWLFPEPDGDMPSHRNAYTAWRRYIKTIGINISPYCLRHTWVSLTKASVPEALQKQIVGHSKSMDTHGVYGHAVNGEMQQAAKLTEKAMKKHLSINKDK